MTFKDRWLLYTGQICVMISIRHRKIFTFKGSWLLNIYITTGFTQATDQRQWVHSYQNTEKQLIVVFFLVISLLFVWTLTIYTPIHSYVVYLHLFTLQTRTVPKFKVGQPPTLLLSSLANHSDGARRVPNS